MAERDGRNVSATPRFNAGILSERPVCLIKIISIKLITKKQIVDIVGV